MTSIDRRRLLTIGAPALALAGTACAAPVARAASPLVIRDSDYLADRARFTTRLTRSGPAPQAGELPALPPGVEMLEVDNGERSVGVWLTRPAGGGPALAPAVIFLHGGFAFAQDDYDMPEPYRAAGFVVAMPILPGEDGRPGVFSMFLDEVDDVAAVVRRVRALPYVDPARVYLAGHSVGGTLTMLGAMASHDIRAATAFSGSPDQFTFLAGGFGRAAPFDVTDANEVEIRSPLAYAKSLKVPTRLYFGDAEGFFRASTPRMAEVGRAAGRDVQAQTFPGDHFGAVPGEIAASIAFFNAHA